MKLTTTKLKKLIQEELNEMSQNPENTGPGSDEDYARQGISIFMLNGVKMGLQVDMNSGMIEIFEINPKNGMPVFRTRVPLRMQK